MRIEEFIRQNRDAFDTETPSDAVWKHVEKQLPKAQINKPRSWLVWRNFRLMQVLAACALLLVGVMLGYWLSPKQQLPTLAFSPVDARMDTEFNEAVAFYQRDIFAKKEKLAQFASVSAEVTSDLDQLEQSLEELKIELQSVPKDQRAEVILAMLSNYKAKASILERVLERLEAQPKLQEKQQQHESSNI